MNETSIRFIRTPSYLLGLLKTAIFPCRPLYCLIANRGKIQILQTGLSLGFLVRVVVDWKASS